MENANKNSKKKSSDFYCEICDYICSRKGDFKKHLISKKHNANKNSKNANKNSKYCLCGKAFKHHSSLCRHIKSCKIRVNEPEKDDFGKGNLLTESEMDESELCNPETHYKNMFLDVMKKNNELTSLLIQQQKNMNDIIHDKSKLLENAISCGEKEQTTNITTNNNTTNNFNISVFLNETCKDAMNLQDFIAGIQSKLQDLDTMKDVGYVECVTQIFVNGLKQLDHTKRPLHCSDVKRETLYIKDDNLWEKDNNKEKLSKAVSSVTRKTLQQLPLWMRNHPECSTAGSTDNKEYHSLIQNTMNHNTINNKKKVMKNIMKEVVIEKEKEK